MDLSAKMRWQCRRGSKELDLLLDRYLQGRYLSADKSERQQFEALLQLDDLELAQRMPAWLALKDLGLLSAFAYVTVREVLIKSPLPRGEG